MRGRATRLPGRLSDAMRAVGNEKSPSLGTELAFISEAPNSGAADTRLLVFPTERLHFVCGLTNEDWRGYDFVFFGLPCL